MNNYPIPKHLLGEFCAYMDANNDDNLPDGAWFAVLEESALSFMKLHHLSGCENNATHQYISVIAKKNQ